MVAVVGRDAAGTSASAPEERAPSPAVDRALTVLETLVDSDGSLTLTSLARQTGIPLASCASIVYTLERRGYATRRVIGRSHFWRPTLRLYGLATRLVRRVDLAQLAQPQLRRLVEACDMPAHVGVLNGPTVVYLAKAAPEGFIQFDTYPGKVSPFNLTALGKAIAAHLPAEELNPLLAGLVDGRGPKGHTAEPARFAAELAAIRDRGYAVEDQEEQSGIGCIAAPFFDADGAVAGSLGVTGFARDLLSDRMPAIAETVCAQAAEMSHQLGHGVAGR